MIIPFQYFLDYKPPSGYDKSELISDNFEQVVENEVINYLNLEDCVSINCLNKKFKVSILEKAKERENIYLNKMIKFIIKEINHNDNSIIIKKINRLLEKYSIFEEKNLVQLQKKHHQITTLLAYYLSNLNEFDLNRLDLKFSHKYGKNIDDADLIKVAKDIKKSSKTLFMNRSLELSEIADNIFRFQRHARAIELARKIKDETIKSESLKSFSAVLVEKNKISLAFDAAEAIPLKNYRKSALEKLSYYKKLRKLCKEGKIEEAVCKAKIMGDDKLKRYVSERIAELYNIEFIIRQKISDDMKKKRIDWPTDEKPAFCEIL